MEKLNKNVTLRNKYNKNKLLCLLAFLFILATSNRVLADANTPVVWFENDGSTTVPSVAQIGNAVITIYFNGNVNLTVGASINGLALNQKIASYNNIGQSVSYYAIAYSSGAIIDAISGGGTDVNGSPQYYCFFHWPAPVECTTNVIMSMYNPYTNTIDVRALGGPNGNTVLSGPISYAGPLNNLNFEVDNVACSNLPVSLNYSNVPPCTTNVIFNVVNTATVWRIFAYQDTSGPADLQGTELVGPGAPYNKTGPSVDCSQLANWHLFTSAGGGDDSVTDSGIGATGTSPGTNALGGAGSGVGGGGGSGSPPPTPPSPPPPSPPVTNTPPPLAPPSTGGGLPTVASSNSPVIWSNTNNDITAVTAATKDAANAIYNAVNQQANQAHSDASGVNSNIVAGTTQQHQDSQAIVAAGTSDANGIIAAINAASALNHADNGVSQNQAGLNGNAAHTDANRIAAAIGNLTNSMGASMTNYNLETTQNKVLNNGVGISNLLAGMAGTNANTEAAQEKRMWGLLPGTATNGDSALLSASSILSAPLATLADDIVGFETPPDVGTDPGHSSIWEMNFVGQRIDLDPVDNFPIVFTFLHGLLEFLIVSGYLLWLGREYYYLVALLATASMGGIPDMDVEGGGEVSAFGFSFGGVFGGNFIGVLVACIVPSAFLGIWIVVVNAVIVPLSTWIGIFNGVSSLFTTVGSTAVGAGGLHLLFAAFPISMFISIATAKISLQLTMDKVTLLAVSASRYLFGR